MQRAWGRAHAELQQDSSWARARGPIAAAYLTLQRVSWTTRAAHLLFDDLGCVFVPLDTAPRDIQDALRQSIQRWQRMQLTQTLPEANSELRWPRVIDTRLRGPRGVKRPKAQGALQCLWAGGMWPRARKHVHGLAPDGLCQARGRGPQTVDHR